MSNVYKRANRRSGENEEEGEDDPFLREDFMQHGTDRAARGSRFSPRNSAEEDTSKWMGDALWDTYRIRPDLAVADKIEILVLQYRLSNTEIARLLKQGQEELDDIIRGMERQWRGLGEPLTSDDKELERGKQIRRLERFIADLDRQLADNRDPRLMTLKLTAIRELTVLRNLTAEKTVSKEEEEIVDDFESAIKNLDAATLQSLHAHLKA